MTFFRIGNQKLELLDNLQLYEHRSWFRLSLSKDGCPCENLALHAALVLLYVTG